MDKEPDIVWIEYTFWIGLDKGTGSEGGEGTSEIGKGAGEGTEAEGEKEGTEKEAF